MSPLHMIYVGFFGRWKSLVTEENLTPSVQMAEWSLVYSCARVCVHVRVCVRACVLKLTGFRRKNKAYYLIVIYGLSKHLQPQFCGHEGVGHIIYDR